MLLTVRDQLEKLFSKPAHDRAHPADQDILVRYFRKLSDLVDDAARLGIGAIHQLHQRDPLTRLTI